LLISSCSIVDHVQGDTNQVHRIQPTTGGTNKATDGRYENLFPKLADYPLTCSENCYAPHQDVACDEPAEQCHYIGKSATEVAANLDPQLTNSGFEVHWLGHASFLVTTANGQQFLFDPVSDEFDWPVNWAHELTGGFTRQTPQWPASKTLSKVDAVLYSHLHYDHFNKADIKKIGNQPTYFVHLDTAEHLPAANLTVKEMDWFTHTEVGDTRVHALPAHHFNSRIWVPFIYDDNEQALWGGWLLEHNGKTLFFAGDTGYSKHFETINDTYGAIDVCLIPIASYHHETQGKWYRYVHTTPEDALQAAIDLDCRVMIPWGYGNTSWKMGDKSTHAPLLRLLNMKKEVAEDLPLLILNEGENVLL